MPFRYELFLICFFLIVSLFSFFANPISAELNLNRLMEEDIQTVQQILSKLTPMIKEKETKGELATLPFEEIYAPLDEKEKLFLQQFQTLDPLKVGIKTKWQGLADGKTELVKLTGQSIKIEGKQTALPTQFVPKDVYEAYVKMMKAMKKNLGKQLYIESAYRSSAYQLYLFISYLQNHNYSVLETAEWNALPGYSEHGNPKSQALDFINEEGISGEGNPESFENLPEYQWLMKNAAKYDFVLSFPKNSPEGIAFEPWHWRYQKDEPKA